MVYVHIDDDKQFYNELLRNKLSIVKVYSNNCAPCKSYAPQFQQMAQRYPYVGFLDINMRSNLVKVTAVPTTLIIKEGVIVDKILGGDIGEVEGKLRGFLDS